MNKDTKLALIFLIILSFLIVKGLVDSYCKEKTKLFVQVPEHKTTIVKAVVNIQDDIDISSEAVAKSVKRFFSKTEQSYATYQLHCLLNKEAKHSADKKHGDNGKAGGAMQFHQPTWFSFRKEMINEGLITEIGSRYDLEQAIETTAWALSEGKGDNWGPILRGDCK